MVIRRLRGCRRRNRQRQEILPEDGRLAAVRWPRVVEIDTDGIYFSPPNGVDVQKLTRELAAELPEGIVLELGEHYPAMFSHKAKNAAFLKADGSMVDKRRRTASTRHGTLSTAVSHATLRLLLEGRPDEVGSLYDGLVRQIRLRELPITDFTKSQTLHVPLGEYRKAVEAGKRNKNAAFELAIKSGRAYIAGDQLSYYMPRLATARPHSSSGRSLSRSGTQTIATKTLPTTSPDSTSEHCYSTGGRHIIHRPP